MKKIIISFLFFFCFFAGRVQIFQQITNLTGRCTTSLDGNWKISVDPFENGYYDSQRNPITNYFGLDKDITDRIMLQEYDFTKVAENSLVVKVKAERHMDAVPTVITDWWNCCGIARSVELLETPMTFIRDDYIQLDKGQSRQITGWVKTDGDSPLQSVWVDIPELKVHQQLSIDPQGFTLLKIKDDPELWSPGDPKLYKINLITELGNIEDEIGFRTIETRGTDILLNGKRIFCRGISIYEEAPYRTGRAYSADGARALLSWAKEMNCNFVRLARYPHNENMIREAERMGIMIWSEIPVYWSI